MNIDTQALIGEVRRLVESIHLGSMSCSAYDTAWVARLRAPHAPHQLSFPQAVSWLLDNQHADGSWGSMVETMHDRCLSTLSGIVALSELGAEGLLHQGEVRLRVSNAAAYLWRRAAALKDDPYETVGFELLFPPLLERARTMGIKLPYAEFAWVERLRQQKLKLVPREMIYSPATTLVHSLEFLDTEADVSLLPGLQAANGSYGNSPSATAYALSHCWSEAGLSYLRQAMGETGGGGVCNVYPFEVFEKAWTLDNLQIAGFRLPEMEQHVEDLARSLGPLGVGASSQGLPADSDDTALVLKVLMSHGHRVSTDLFRHYEGAQGYLCFPFERNPSVSANVHILAVLKEGGSRKPEVRRIVDFLLSARREGAYWQDKWHASPYYATGHAIQALHGVENKLVNPAVDWLLSTQRPDGSWGVFRGTCEETAYALQALMTVGQTNSPRMGPAIGRGIEYLLHTRETVPVAELWIGKGLYAPLTVVRSVILGTLLQYVAYKGAVLA